MAELVRGNKEAVCNTHSFRLRGNYQQFNNPYIEKYRIKKPYDSSNRQSGAVKHKKIDSSPKDGVIKDRHLLQLC